MPVRRPSVPKYRHYKPKDLAVVRLNGRDHYLGKFDSPDSRRLYDRWVAEWFWSRPPTTAPTAKGRMGSKALLRMSGAPY